MSEIKSITVQGTAINVKDETARTNLASEISRATDAEGVLDGKIDAEETRAKNKENSLENSINANTANINYLLSLNTCTGIKWSRSAITKQITYVGGDTLKTNMMNWIDNSAKPCEVKKDMTGFNYLLNTAGVASSTNWTKLSDGSTSSHYNSSDKADYLQMVELQNVNVRFIENVDADESMVLFNFDTICPVGFHRWFPEPTKLFARYDSTKNGSDSSRLDVMLGAKWTDENSVSVMHSMNTATNANILEWTGWEIAVLGWLMAYKYGTFDLQSALGVGLAYGSKEAAEAFTNGLTDSLTIAHGKVATGSNNNEAIRFMYIENPYGLRWIWGAGVRGEKTAGYFTYDDLKANKAALMALTDADETFTISSTSSTYAKNVNALGVLTELGGSSSSGFYDGNWSNITVGERILYCGGSSYHGSLGGPFARGLTDDVTTSAWNLRSRCGVRKSVVS